MTGKGSQTPEIASLIEEKFNCVESKQLVLLVNCECIVILNRKHPRLSPSGLGIHFIICVGADLVINKIITS